MWISSSIVKIAPHLGHLTSVSFLIMAAQPEENAAKTPITNHRIANLCISQYPSFSNIFQEP
jgi:hypothetical protein